MTVLAAEKLRRAALWRNAWDARAIVAEAAADLLDAIDAAVEELRSEHLPHWSRTIVDEMHRLLHPKDGDA